MSHKSTGEHLVQSLSARPGEEDVQAMGLSDGGDSWVCLSTVPSPLITRIMKPGSQKTQASQLVLLVIPFLRWHQG